MPQTAPYKTCPRCRTPADVTAPVCATCGRQFKTVFPPPVAPVIHGAGAAMGGVSTVAWAEYVRQWAMLNGFVAWGVVGMVAGAGARFFLPLGALSVVGVVALVYGVVQRQGLRRRVTEAGESPDRLAAEGNRRFFPGFWKAVGSVGGVIAVGLAITFSYRAIRASYDAAHGGGAVAAPSAPRFEWQPGAPNAAPAAVPTPDSAALERDAERRSHTRLE